MKMKADDFQKKFSGVIFGTAVGDALGYPVEFQKGGPPVTGLRNGGLVSDDTQMMVATLEGLMRAGTWNDVIRAGEAVANSYVEWASSPKNNRAPGNACMAGCRALAAGVPWERAGVNGAGGCGTAMRSMAYGIWHYRDPDIAGDWAASHARMTHRSPMAQAAAAAVAAGVAAAIQDLPCEQVARLAQRAALGWSEDVAKMLALAQVWAAESLEENGSVAFRSGAVLAR